MATAAAVVLVLAIAATAAAVHASLLLLASQRAGIARQLPLYWHFWIAVGLWIAWAVIR